MLFMESFNKRTCPYCGIELVKAPYWRHVEQEHPSEYASDRSTWIQLFKDYSSMGMDSELCIQVICDLFNQTKDLIRDFLKENKIIE